MECDRLALVRPVVGLLHLLPRQANPLEDPISGGDRAPGGNGHSPGDVLPALFVFPVFGGLCSFGGSHKCDYLENLAVPFYFGILLLGLGFAPDKAEVPVQTGIFPNLFGSGIRGHAQLGRLQWIRRSSLRLAPAGVCTDSPGGPFPQHPASQHPDCLLYQNLRRTAEQAEDHRGQGNRLDHSPMGSVALLSEICMVSQVGGILEFKRVL